MAQKKNVQVLLSDEEESLVREAAVRSGVTDMRGFIAGRARSLLMAWAMEELNTRGGVAGGVCGSTSGCQNAGAVWFNTRGRFFVCPSCAESTNRLGPFPVCVLGGENAPGLPERLSPAALDRVLAAAVQAEIERRGDDLEGTARRARLKELLSLVERVRETAEEALRDDAPKSTLSGLGLFSRTGLE